MAPQDAAWLGMERPTNLMVVTAVLVLDGAPDLEALTAAVRHRLVEVYPGFRRRPVRTRGPWPRIRWQDADPDLSRHLRSTALTGPIATHLDPFVAALMGRALDRGRPLWLMHLLVDPAGECALVVRVHHCVGDGSALVQVLLSLTDPGSAGDPPVKPPSPPASAARRMRDAGPLTAVRVLAELVRVPLLRHEPSSHLRGPLGRVKTVARGRGVDLDLVKRRAGGASVNEVVLAAVAGGLRRRFVAAGEAPVDVRALVPVDLRPPGAAVPRALGNRFGMVLVELPVSEPDAEGRIVRVRRRSLAARASSQAQATFAGLTLLGLLPASTQALAVRLLGARATAVVTNVRGPGQPVTLAGRRVQQITFWVPQTGAVGVGISVLSYAGSLSVGVAADARLLPDPRALADAIEHELGGG